MVDEDKPLVWLGGEIKSPPFSLQARIEVGTLLRQLQKGKNVGLPHSRPMPSIGPRCHELRIPDVNQNWRIVYRTDFDAIVVVEVFAKKSGTTPIKVIRSCKSRLRVYDSQSEGE